MSTLRLNPNYSDTAYVPYNPFIEKQDFELSKINIKLKLLWASVPMTMYG